MPETASDETDEKRADDDLFHAPGSNFFVQQERTGFYNGCHYKARDN